MLFSSSHTHIAGYADPMQTFGDVLAELDVFVRCVSARGVFYGWTVSSHMSVLPVSLQLCPCVGQCSHSLCETHHHTPRSVPLYRDVWICKLDPLYY